MVLVCVWCCWTPLTLQQQQQQQSEPTPPTVNCPGYWEKLTHGSDSIFEILLYLLVLKWFTKNLEKHKFLSFPLFSLRFATWVLSIFTTLDHWLSVFTNNLTNVYIPYHAFNRIHNLKFLKFCFRYCLSVTMSVVVHSLLVTWVTLTSVQAMGDRWAWADSSYRAQRKIETPGLFELSLN